MPVCNALFLKKACSLLVTLAWLTASMAGLLPGNVAMAQGIFTEDNSRQIRALNSPDELPGRGVLVSFSVRGANVRDMLRALGRQGGFNVMVDDSVEGIVSVDMVDVPVPVVLQAIATQNQLHYALRNNNTLLVFSGETINDQELRRTHTDIIPLQYANSLVLANILNSTVFANQNRGASGSGNTSPLMASYGTSGGNQQLLAITPDFRTNSLIVVGTERDIEVAREYVERLDQPRSSRTWRLSHADALDVATLLSSSLFNEGTSPLMLTGSGGGSGGSGGAGGGSMGSLGGNAGNQPGSTPSLLRVRSEMVEEGNSAISNTASSGAGSSGGGSGSGGGSSAGGGGGSGSGARGTSGGGSGGITLRANQKVDEMVQVSPMGAIIVPDTRLNAITILGTQTQLALAENMIARLDQPAPQVMIEASLVEINESALKELSSNFSFDYREFSAAFNGIQSVIGFDTVANGGNRINFSAQINALIRQNRAKLLANPNILSIHDKQSVISIVDEVIESITVTLDSEAIDPDNPGDSIIGREVNIGEVGITLDVLPRISPNGSINLRVQPSLSTVIGTREDRFGNIVTLLSRRVAQGQQVKLRDGETFVMGGLIQETDSDSVNKYPFLGDIPILGALARNSSRNRSRTELLIILTPHIVKEDSTGPGILPGPVEPRVINAMAFEMPPARTVTPTISETDLEAWRQRRTPAPEQSAPIRGMW